MTHAEDSSSPNGKVVVTPATRQASPPARPSRPAVAASSGLLTVIWDAWKAYAKRAGGYQTNVLLTLLYFVVLGPSALIARAFGSALLDLSTQKRPTYWEERKPDDRSLEALRRQF